MGTVITIEGKAHWAMVQKPGGKYDKFQILVAELTEDSAKAVGNSFIGHKVEHGPDNQGVDYGENWVRISRKGEDGKPVVVGPDGRTPFDGLIGNGSTVRVQFETWQSKNHLPNGHRLLGVQVLTLVPYGNKAEASFGDVSESYEDLPETSAMSEVVFGDEADKENV